MHLLGVLHDVETLFETLATAALSGSVGGRSEIILRPLSASALLRGGAARSTTLYSPKAEFAKLTFQRTAAVGPEHS